MKQKAADFLKIVTPCFLFALNVLAWAANNELSRIHDAIKGLRKDVAKVQTSASEDRAQFLSHRSEYLEFRRQFDGGRTAPSA